MEVASKTYIKTCQDLSSVYREWETNREWAILRLESIVKEMDSREFGENVVQIVSSSASLLGAGAIIAGLFLAPVTGGLSVLAGAAVGVAGGVTSITSENLNNNFAVEKLKQAEDIINADQEMSQKFAKAEQKMLDAFVVIKSNRTSVDDIVKLVVTTDNGLHIPKLVKNMFKVTKAETKLAATGVAAETKVMATGAMAETKVMASGARSAGKLFGKLSVGLAVVGAGFDIWSIVKNSDDITEGSKSKVGKEITKHIDDLKKSLKDVQENYKEVMKSTC